MKYIDRLIALLLIPALLAEPCAALWRGMPLRLSQTIRGSALTDQALCLPVANMRHEHNEAALKEAQTIQPYIEKHRPRTSRLPLTLWKATIRRKFNEIDRNYDHTDFKRPIRALESLQESLQFLMGMNPYRYRGPRHFLRGAELIDFAEFLHTEWRERGYRDFTGTLNVDIILMNTFTQDVTHFVQAERRIQLMIRGTTTERLLGLWAGGVKVAAHLRTAGLHMLNRDHSLIDLEQILIPNVRRFIPLLLQWQTHHRADEYTHRMISQLHLNQRARLSFQALMHWGLLMQINPSIYKVKYAPGLKPGHRLYRYIQNHGGLSAIRINSLKRMLFIPNQDLDRIENLVADALAHSGKYWKARGVIPPWHAHHNGNFFLSFSRYDREEGIREPYVSMLTSNPGQEDEVAERKCMELGLFEILPKLEQKLARRTHGRYRWRTPA